MQIRRIHTIALSAAVAVACLPAFAAPLGNTFSYQGKLLDGTVQVTGTFDFVFRLFDANQNGNQIGSDFLADNVDVVDGLFTVDLNFGSGMFVGEARWLEIGVRPGDQGGMHTILTPRQPLHAAPFALYAMDGGHWKASGTAIMNANTGFVGINRSTRVTAAEFFGIQATVTGTNYGGMYIRTDGVDAQPFYGYSTGDESAWTYLEGDTGSWHVFNGDERLTVTSDGDVGINDTTPDARLDVLASDGHAIEANATGAFSYGVRGVGLSAGVRGECGTSNGAGVYGVNNSATGTGVRGDCSSTGAGMAGYANLGTGVYAQTSSGYGVYGSNGGDNDTGYAGYFNGRVHVNGNLSKNGGAFKIDHPLDPANKFLSHSFVESPDMMNIYNGIALLDESGNAMVTLPDWFEALNSDFRYQLTAIGAAAPDLHIAQEVAGNQFAIAGGQAGMKVSWLVTGVRQDAWAQANRIPVEEQKSDNEKGLYLTPEAFGLGADMAIDHEVRNLGAAAANLDAVEAQ